MKLHGNAETTPVTRALQARVRREGWSVARPAAAQSISRQTAYRWLAVTPC